VTATVGGDSFFPYRSAGTADMLLRLMIRSLWRVAYPLRGSDFLILITASAPFERVDLVALNPTEARRKGAER
jgi:hypothetical protein